MQVLPLQVSEKSSCKITVSFLESTDGSTITPDSSLFWTLTDEEGTVINSRSAVEITTPTSSEDIYLSGDDLQILDSSKSLELRIITVETTYDPGSGSINLKEAAQFVVTNLVAIS